MNTLGGIQWGKVTFGAGVAMMAVAGLLAAVRNTQRAPSVAPPVAQVIPAALTPSPARPPIEDAVCDAHGAPGAMLRERGTGAQIAGRAIRLLEILNGLPQDSIHVLGWSAEDSAEGPPCYATFAYEMRGVRHTARFKFWPRAPSRLATANGDAEGMADAVELLAVNGVAHSQVQLTLASAMRVTSGFLAEDVYMSPRSEGEMIIRRPHCVDGNVDFSGTDRGARVMVRALRRAHITRVRCVADNPWVADIPPRGALPPPYLAEADAGL